MQFSRGVFFATFLYKKKVERDGDTKKSNKKSEKLN